jgi:hypothetical protein
MLAAASAETAAQAIARRDLDVEVTRDPEAAAAMHLKDGPLESGGRCDLARLRAGLDTHSGFPIRELAEG